VGPSLRISTTLRSRDSLVRVLSLPIVRQGKGEATEKSSRRQKHRSAPLCSQHHTMHASWAVHAQHALRSLVPQPCLFQSTPTVFMVPDCRPRSSRLGAPARRPRASDDISRTRLEISIVARSDANQPPRAPRLVTMGLGPLTRRSNVRCASSKRTA